MKKPVQRALTAVGIAGIVVFGLFVIVGIAVFGADTVRAEVFDEFDIEGGTLTMIVVIMIEGASLGILGTGLGILCGITRWPPVWMPITTFAVVTTVWAIAYATAEGVDGDFFIAVGHFISLWLATVPGIIAGARAATD
ncbi:hypothetical protein ACQPZP_20630 [Spirillospora sp. CA-142024]|uniref:hypothetical protein n=1 Tax=Spirillospora sp. CA-142024 TaxID=3240036 RepID=UPI003D93E968